MKYLLLIPSVDKLEIVLTSLHNNNLLCYTKLYLGLENTGTMVLYIS